MTAPVRAAGAVEAAEVEAAEALQVVMVVEKELMI